jgi:hypothetical protein
VIPSPQTVALRSGDLQFDDSWTLDSGRIASNHIAVRTLLRDLQEFHSIDLKRTAVKGARVIRLSVKMGTVQSGADAEIDRQGYALKLTPGLIEITGNADAGLFYGVQTFLQLLKPADSGKCLLPEAAIEDWPAHHLRFLHWDTKHHQDRLETLKRYLDWSARFKINMIGFELEDKFEYPSHRIIGAPGAFTAAQLQEIVNYGLERHIQVVPQIQSPAHMAYVLKHPEFADLRADGNNYQACLCDQRSYDLIFSMHDDVIKATQGVEYFFVSTDEVYYAGICAKCDQPYNPENRSLKWAEFARRAHDFLAAKGRKMLAWVEYPFLPQHLDLLPSGIIDGVLGSDPNEIKAENQRGMRHLAYVSMQGAELLFPNHLLMQTSSGLGKGRLEAAFEEISVRSRVGNPIGVYGAAWDDSGLHNETFWLGWATVAEYGWTPGFPSVEQTAAEFMNVYYGPQATGMIDIYRSLQQQARFFEGSWDRVVSKARGPGYGNSYGKGIGTTRFDQTLPRPALPSLPGLSFTPVYVDRYARLAAEARQRSLENDVLMHSLQENFTKVARNRYNLEVLLSLAEFTAHHNRMVQNLQKIEESLKRARESAEKNTPKQAVGCLVEAYDLARETVEERRRAFDFLKTIWEKSRFPKGQEVSGRKFLHVLDDVKDHWADRRAGLSYMIAPEESIGLEQWMEDLTALIHSYARKNDLPIRPLEVMRLED